MKMRRRAAAALVAVVVAAGLSACGGGDGDGGGTDDEGRPLLPVALGAGGGGSARTAELSAEVAADGAAGASTLAGAPPVQYRIKEGVEAPAEEAGAYRFVPEDDGATAKLEEALGGGAGTTVDVRHGAWFFQREVSGSTQTAECRVLPDGSCEEKPMPPPPPGVPSAADAEAKLRRILATLGVDASKGRVVVQEAGEPVYTRAVTFEPTVDGLPVQDLATTVAFGENGRVDYANGFLGRFEKLGDYPLVALDAALERFQAGFVGGDARVATGAATAPGPTVVDSPTAASEGSGGGTSGSTGSAGASDPGSAGSGEVPPAPADQPPATVVPSVPAEPPAPIEPQVIEVTGAELVLTAVYPRCEGDDLLLVPAFRLLPSEAGFTVPAVDEASVAPPANSEQSSEPCPGQPAPDEPVGRPEPAPMPPDAGGREPAAP